MAIDSADEIAVIYPMVDVRGRAVEHVRTWTHGQTLARDRYCVVVATDGTSVAQEREVRQLLGPRDAMICLPNASEEALLNAAAARAGTPWLVFTEGHCRAQPDCLEAVARWIASSPRAQAGNFRVDHGDPDRFGELIHRWFDMLHARWLAPDEWPRIHVAGFAIRTDVFATSGGFEAYDVFAPALLSARLHAGGTRIEPVPGAAVLHIDDDRMRTIISPPRTTSAVRSKFARAWTRSSSSATSAT
jgi:hypothetical protein